MSPRKKQLHSQSFHTQCRTENSPVTKRASQADAADKPRTITQAGRQRVEVHAQGSGFCIDPLSRVFLRGLRVSLTTDAARKGPDKRS